MFGKLPVAAIVVKSSDDLKRARPRIFVDADLFLDAILGTGFKPPVSGLYAEAIAMLNASRAPVIAVDIPSGADADAMGPQTGLVARADAIVTFTAARPAHVFSALTSGPTLVAEIGSPPEAIVSALQLNVITAHDFAAVDWAASGGLEQRELWACAGGRRIARQGGVGGDGGNGGSASRSGAVDCGDAEVRAADGRWISSGVDDRAFAQKPVRARFRRGAEARLDRSGEREERARDRAGDFAKSRDG